MQAYKINFADNKWCSLHRNNQLIYTITIRNSKLAREQQQKTYTEQEKQKKRKTTMMAIGMLLLLGKQRSCKKKSKWATVLCWTTVAKKKFRNGAELWPKSTFLYFRKKKYTHASIYNWSLELWCSSVHYYTEQTDILISCTLFFFFFSCT